MPPSFGGTRCWVGTRHRSRPLDASAQVSDGGDHPERDRSRRNPFRRTRTRALAAIVEAVLAHHRGDVRVVVQYGTD